MAINTQKYRATVEFEWTGEVFSGDPDDVFELAALEKEYARGVFNDAAVKLSADDGVFKIIAVDPVIDLP